MADTIIDSTVYAELQDAAGAEFVVELIGTFLEEAPAILAELRAALAGGQADAFRRAAHSIKSNANTFGARALAGLARDLELGGLAAADADHVAALETAYREAAAALQELARG